MKRSSCYLFFDEIDDGSNLFFRYTTILKILKI